MMGNVVKVVVNLEPIKQKEYGYMEFWNPTVDQLKALVPYLEQNMTIAFVWVYGEVEDIEDYSPLIEAGDRIVKPFWLGKTKEVAYKFYTENRDYLVGDFPKEPTWFLK